MQSNNNAVKTFTFKTDTEIEIRTITIDGQPWFYAVDICSCLGLKNTHMALKPLDDDEKIKVKQIDCIPSRGNPYVSVVNESGLYTMIVRSDKPIAKPFRKWVTGEVLPTIRKTGAYMTPETLIRATKDPVFVVGLLQNLADEQLKSGALQLENDELTTTLEEHQTVNGHLAFHVGGYLPAGGP